MNLTRLLHIKRQQFNFDSLTAKSLRSPVKILAVQIAGIGDLVLATPALDATREKYPNAQIDLLTSPRADKLIEGHPSVNSIYTFDIGRYRNLKRLFSPTDIKKLINDVRPLRKEKYDILLSLNNVSTSRGAYTLGFLINAINPGIRVGRNTNNRAQYFDYELVEKSTDPIPEAITKLKVASLIGADPAPRSLTMGLGKKDRDFALSKLDNRECEWIGILPGANVESKIWPAERFAHVAESLYNKGFAIALLGGPGDVPIAKKVKSRIEYKLLKGNSEKANQSLPLENFCGKLSLRETAAVIQQLKMVVTNDTGPMHIAAAVGTPIVAVYGPSNSTRYRPWAPENRYRIFHEILDCNPCNYEICPMEKWCMNQIQSEQVIKAAEELLMETN